MRIDLFHNKIVKDTMTESFERSVREVLVPLVEAEYPEADGILMYEDYIADGFAVGDTWYYPLTVEIGAEARTVWVSWRFWDWEFSSRSPYSFVGDGLVSFALCESVPAEFEAALAGRAISYDRSAIKVNVRAAADDPLILVGGYSQTFVDEFAVQMTHEISRSMGIESLGESSIELELVFAPGTYMEHTSENVTYRRLLLVDGASKPRDFWVKWTRLGGGAACTVSDHILDRDVMFELGEDVPHKIREKEYRFLCSSNPTAYQSAMGKKSVTEWREPIKRAIRRGEIIKIESELVIAERAGEVHDKMAELLGNLGFAKPETKEPEEAVNDSGFESLMDMARAALKRSEAVISGDESRDEEETQPAAEEAPEAEGAEDEIPAFLMGGLDFADGRDDVEGETACEPEAESEEIIEDTEEVVEEAEAVVEESEEAPEEIEEEETVADEVEETDPVDTEDGFGEEITIDELLRRVDEADAEDAAAEDEHEAEPVAYTPFEIAACDEPIVESGEVITEDDEAEDEDIDEPAVADEDQDISEEDEETVVEAEESVEVDIEEMMRRREEIMRREIEAKIRLEYEAQARAKAEIELERLLAESRALREENERLAKAARDAKELHDQAISEQIDAAERARANEELLRRELEAKERQEARERDRMAEAARIAVEQQRRLEAEQQAKEEEERLAREEAERARAEAEEREARERAAEEARRAAEAQFISKRARIIFRYAVDPNIISSIRTIIEDTIKREGKQHVRIHMKAYQEDRDTINLDILKMPREEQELLVSIVKAIGNARIGVIKIILE